MRKQSDKGPAPSKPELLAPAGRIEAFLAALDAGADAVYVGAHQFNARMRARNFSLDELSRMASLAHGMGRKLYITLNTLIKESELPELVETLDALRRIGPDALILQDLGVYRLARELAPELPLHASTQMTVHNLDGALQAQKLGFERAILARELTLNEIRAIRASSTIEIETFIHGALCYSISGQCLFSSYAHGKSANRGRCLQPCRRLYEAEGGDAEACFSMHDLSAAPVLTQLIAAGIRSFKIEGRLKPPETIAQVVRAYRLLLDAYPNISGETISAARRNLEVAMGRESSTGYFVSARPGNVLGSGETHSGSELGKSLPAARGYFGLQAQQSVKTGDRLRVQVSKQETPRGFTVTEIRLQGQVLKRSRPGQRIEIAAPFPVPAGSLVIKAADADAQAKGATRRFERMTAAMTLPSKAALPAVLDAGERELRIEATIGGDTLRLAHPFNWGDTIAAKEAAALLEQASERFEVRLRVAVPRGLGELPIDEKGLAAFREKALFKASRLLDQQKAAVLEGVRQARPRGARAETLRILRFTDLRGLARVRKAPETECASDLYSLPLECLEQTTFREMARELREQMMLALPTFQFEAAEHVRAAERLRKAIELGIRRFEVSNLAHFNLIRATGRRGLFVLSTAGIGCMNAAAHAQLRELGADAVTYSLDGDAATLEQLIEHVPASQVAIQVYSYPSLFQSRAPGPHPPGGTLRLTEPRDVFRVEARGGIVHVMAKRPFSLRHRLDWLRGLGLFGVVYDLTSLPPSEDAVRILHAAPAAPDPKSEQTFNFERTLE